VQVSEFNPETVPTVQDLATEFNQYASENVDSGMSDKEMISTFQSQSCLKDHIAVFDKFLKGVHRAVNADLVAHAREVRETPTIDF